MRLLFLSFFFLIPAIAQAGDIAVSTAAAPASQAQQPQAPPPQIQPPKVYDLKDGPGFCIFGGWSGKPFGSEAAFKSVIWKSDVIHVGETHDQIKDHLAQLEVLKTLRVARGAKIAVGFEMLNVTLQPALDDYVSGKLTEEEFLQKTDWAKEWKFDFGLYKPLFDFIIQNKLKALALNVPKKIVSKIARVGLAGLDAEEKKFLPEPVNIPTHKKYLEFLKTSFDGHGDTPPPASAPKAGSKSPADSAQAGGGVAPLAKISTWDNYLASMAAWNEAMGAKIADFVNANPGWSALVVTGNSHVIYNAAIPASVKARTNKIRQASFYTEDAAKCPAEFPKTAKDTANYVWYINHGTDGKK
ncbi:MAG: ChaN family lipoprotein [Elusimicrobia bacterium]|nr:ChaN family lipoprotein [Elusimicrobiota bacterium]